MKTKIFTFIIAVGLLVSSCDDFLDVNKDPNNPENVTPDLVLPVGLNYTSGYIGGDRQLNHLGSMMMYSYGEAEGFDWYASEFNYLLTGGFYNQMFEDPYNRPLKQYNVLTQQPEEFGYYKAIGNIMKAYHFQILVDLYGSIPYTEALQRGANSTPAYDEPQAVYDSLITQLTDAVNTIDETDALSGAVQVGSDDDAVFGGDMEKWGAFANSIKIRILTRESGVKEANYINTELANIQSNGYGYITGNVGINPGYIEGEEDKQNPYWSQMGIDFEGSAVNTYNATPATQFVINFFQGINDPRLDYIFETPSSGAHKGVNQGSKIQIADTDGLVPSEVSNLNMPSSYDDANGPNNATLGDGEGILRGPTMPTIIMTQAELQFNLAELAFKNFDVSGSAQSYYEAGITASLNYLGVPDTAATAYMNQTKENVGWTSSTSKMNAIHTQKWLALFGLNMGQVWFDYSRTGFPNAQPVGVSSSPIATASSGFPISLEANEADRPVRLLYPNSEASNNSENVPPNSQIDPFTDKIFWAQ